MAKEKTQSPSPLSIGFTGLIPSCEDYKDFIKPIDEKTPIPTFDKLMEYLSENLYNSLVRESNDKEQFYRQLHKKLEQHKTKKK